MTEKTREVMTKVEDAFKSERFFITVSKLNQDNSVDHYYVTEKFPTGEVLPALKKVAEMHSDNIIEPGRS